MTAGVIGVRFREASRIYHYALPDEADEVFVGEYVVVETPRGRELGYVVTTPDGAESARRDVKPIVRLATREDRDQALEMQRHGEAMLARAKAIVQRDGLAMFVAGFQLDLEGKEATGHFHADSHVNFRSLVQEIEDEFGVRVHMQHAGPRDRAKLVDGYDICGLRLCCASWMTDFPRVGIRMAKEQDLALNPDKISGVCGRLLCCLTFEFDVYREMRGQLPKVGKKVSTPVGMGKVIQVNPLAQKVTILLEDSNERVDVPGVEIGLAVRVEEAPNQALVEAERVATEPDRDDRAPGRSPAPRARAGGPAGLRRSARPEPAEGDAESAEGDRRPRRRRRRRRGGQEGGADGGSGAEAASPEATPGPASREPAAERAPAEARDPAEPGARSGRRRRRRRSRGRSDGGADGGTDGGGPTGGDSPA